MYFSTYNTFPGVSDVEAFVSSQVHNFVYLGWHKVALDSENILWTFYSVHFYLNDIFRPFEGFLIIKNSYRDISVWYFVAYNMP